MMKIRRYQTIPLNQMENMKTEASDPTQVVSSLFFHCNAGPGQGDIHRCDRHDVPFGLLNFQAVSKMPSQNM